MANSAKGYLYALILAVLLTGGAALPVKAQSLLADSVTAPISGKFSGSFEPLTGQTPFDPAGVALFDITNNKIPWSVLYGKVVILNFWATWCPSCLVELPSLEDLRGKRGGKDLAVVYVSVDFPKNGDDLVGMMKRTKMSEINSYYINDMAAWSVLRLDGIPMTLLLDRQGRPLYRMVGDTDWTSPEMLAFIDAAIAQE